MTQHRSTRPIVLGVLFGVLVVLELVPILAALTYHKLWMLSNHEDFNWSFWPPLIPSAHHSYFFFQTGMLYWVLVRPVHWVTAWLLHSQLATILYMQVFGYLVRIEFSALTLGLAVWILVTKHLEWTAKATILVFMNYTIVVTPDIFRLYQFRVGLQLDYRLVQATACILLVAQLEQYFERGQGAWLFPVLAGIFGGLVFFDMPLYSYLTLFLIGGSLAATTSRARSAALLRLAGSGTLAGAVLVYLFYYGDVDSILAAIHSQVSGILRGFPQPQPRFRENFVDLALHPASSYFPHQVLLLGGVILAIVLSIWYVRRPALDRKPLYDGRILEFSLLYLFALVVHLNVMRTHGSYTVVFSAVFLTILYMLLMVFIIVRRAGMRGHRTLVVSAAGVLTLLFIFEPAYNFGLFGMNHLETYPGAFRSGLGVPEPPTSSSEKYERFLHEVDSKYTYVVKPDTSSCVVGWQYALAQGWVHTGSGIGDITGATRYRGTLQRERFPAWHTYYSQAIEKLTYRGGRFQARIVDVPIAHFEYTWIIPLPNAFGRQWALSSADRAIIWLEYQQVRGRVRRTLVDGYPRIAVYETKSPQEPDSRAWFVLPLSPEAVADKYDTLIRWPPAIAAIKAGYLPFIGWVCGDYPVGHVHILLVEARETPASQALTRVIVAQERLRQEASLQEARKLGQAVRAYFAAHGCYPSWTGAMPAGLGPYMEGSWPLGYHYLALDAHQQGAGKGSTAHYIGVAATLLDPTRELSETVWVVRDRPVPVCH